MASDGELRPARGEGGEGYAHEGGERHFAMHDRACGDGDGHGEGYGP